VSLVSEGLKKAHLDAVRRDHEQRSYLAGPRVVRQNSAMSASTIMMIAVASAAIAAAAAVIFLRKPAPQPAAVVVHRAVSAPAKPVVVVPAPAPAPVTSPAPAPVVVARKAPPKIERPIVEEEKAPPQRMKRDGFVDGESYASPVKGPLGFDVSLTGISSSGGQTLAIVNGGLVREGSTIGPFTVERIERTRVQFRYVDVHFFVTP